MKKTLINKSLIVNSAKVESKDQLFEIIADLALKAGRTSSKEEIIKDLKNREKDGSTAFENGLMIPHARTSSITTTTLVIVEFEKSQDFESIDNLKTDFAVSILVPTNAESEHLRILSKLSKLFSTKENLAEFRQLSTAQKIEKINSLQNSESADEHLTSNCQYDIVAITSCAAGVAHTYMARDALVYAAEKMGYTCKVETRGSMTENKLTKTDIVNAKVAIIASDVKISKSIFAGKKMVFVSTNEAIKSAETVIQAAFDAEVSNNLGQKFNPSKTGLSKIENERTKWWMFWKPKHGSEKVFMKSLMSAISFMIPVVVVGGILMAIPNAIVASNRTTKDTYSVWAMPNNFVGSMWDFAKVALTLMVPVLAMVLALKIGGKPAAPAGLVGGFFINDGNLLGKYAIIELPKSIASNASAGFLGGLVVGIFAGYLVRWMKWIKWHRSVKPIAGLLLIPIISSFFTYIFVVWVIGSPMTWLMSQIYVGLSSVQSQGLWVNVLIGMMFSAFMAVDLGGPINKTALTVATAIFTDTITTDNPYYVPRTAVVVAISVPPIGMWIATTFFKTRFSKIERAAGAAALPMGMVGISEGAIPFAFKTPLRAIAANVAGASVAGAVATFFGIRWFGGMASPFGSVLGYSEHSGYGMFWIVSIICGAVVTGVTYALMMKKIPENVEEYKAIELAKKQEHIAAGRTTKSAVLKYKIHLFKKEFIKSVKYGANPKHWFGKPDDWDDAGDDI